MLLCVWSRAAPHPARVGGDSEDVQFFEEFLIQEYERRLVAVLREPDVAAHYSIGIDLTHHAGHATVLKVLSDPLPMLKLLDEAGRDAQTTLATRLEGASAGHSYTVKGNAHVRVVSVPSRLLRAVSALRSGDVGSFICVAGTVVRTGGVMMCEVDRTYSCAKCGHTFPLSGDIAQRGEFRLPSVCPARVPGRKPCGGTRFTREERAFSCREYQEIKLQEQVKSLGVGSVPRTLLVVLTDELADTVKPGDDVEIVGILHRRWHRTPTPGQRADVELMLAATGVSLTNARKSFLHLSDEAVAGFEAFWAAHRSTPLAGRNAILQSLCPQLYGMYVTKLIVAMSLIGGAASRDDSGTTVRGESHLLIVGDPGTAKSQILRYAALLSPRAVLTTGIGTTSAGLTTTAVRDAGSGQWMLDAGALVLADGGLCCIDEFDSIREGDRGSIHEAMEQQTLSVAKAGLVCTLSTRTTVFAAVNPKAGKLGSTIYVPTTDTFSTPGDRSQGGVAGGGGGGGTSKALPIELAIAAPLLSRFDVVLTLLDRHDESWDKALSTFILDGCRHTGAAAAAEATAATARWSLDRLRQYIFYVKNRLHPRLSREARLILSRYYSAERRGDGRNVSRTTVRLMEALIRLTVAHARLMFRRQWATAQDAAFAVAAVEASAASQPVLGGGSALHAPFPADPDGEYRTYALFLQSKLRLEDLVETPQWAPRAADADAGALDKAEEAEGQEEAERQEEGASAFGLPSGATGAGSGSGDTPTVGSGDGGGAPSTPDSDDGAAQYGGGTSTPAAVRQGDVARAERAEQARLDAAVGVVPDQSQLSFTAAAADAPRRPASYARKRPRPTAASDEEGDGFESPAPSGPPSSTTPPRTADSGGSGDPAGGPDDATSPAWRASTGAVPPAVGPDGSTPRGWAPVVADPPAIMAGATTPDGQAPTASVPSAFGAAGGSGAPFWTQPKAPAAFDSAASASDLDDVFKGLEEEDEEDVTSGVVLAAVPSAPPALPLPVMPAASGGVEPRRIRPPPAL